MLFRYRNDTNEEAERSLRMARLHKKLSRSLRAIEAAERLASICAHHATAPKHGAGALGILAQLFRGE